MNEKIKKAAAHPAGTATITGGTIVAAFFALLETGVLEKLNIWPRVAVIERELDMAEPRSRLDRIETILSNREILEEERARRETDVYGAILEMTNEMRAEREARER